MGQAPDRVAPDHYVAAVTVPFNKFNQFVADLTNKVHNLGTDVLKLMLTNVAPVATNSVKADITEIGAANGYTAGGNQVTQISNGQVGGLETLKLNGASWAASGGPISPFRYVVLYNSTPGTGPLIGWWDFGATLNISPGQGFKVTFDGTNGVLQLQ